MHEINGLVLKVSEYFFVLFLFCCFDFNFVVQILGTAIRTVLWIVEQFHSVFTENFSKFADFFIHLRERMSFLKKIRMW